MIDQLGYTKEYLKNTLKLPNEPLLKLFSSLDVNYWPPHVERLSMPWHEGRLILHCIHQCDAEAALIHNHEWPAAMEILAGEYTMQTYSTHEHGWEGVVMVPGDNRYAPKGPITTVRMRPGCQYEMLDRDTFHSVCPTTPTTLSIMVTGKRWETAEWTGRFKNWTPYPVDRAPVGKMGDLTNERKVEILDQFRSVLGVDGISQGQV